MDHMKQCDIQTMSQLSQSHFAKKAIIQILLSLSLFSFLFSYSSLLPFLLHCFDHCFPTLSLKLLAYTTDRNYIFLLCNGILVFLIKESGLISKSEAYKSVSELSESKAGVGEGVMEVEEGRENEVLVRVGGGENVILTTQDVDGNEETEQLKTIEEEEEGKEEEEEEEEEGIGILSAEELKKKCDDFIRRVKEGIRIESKQQIMV